MGKFSSYPADSSPTSGDYVLTVDSATSSNRKVLLSDLLTFFYTQTNIPVGGGSVVTRSSETQFDHVVPGGLVITADSVGVNRNASISAGTVYINGRRLSISASTARTYTASKDTYIDVLDNLDGTGTLVFTETTNNAASVALAANSLRIGIVVTGATTIATTGSINQGQEDKVLPIASSIPYTVTDSLGNLICPRDSTRRTLGFRKITSNFSTASASAVQVTGLTVPFIGVVGVKVEADFILSSITNGSAANVAPGIWDGTVGSGTQLDASTIGTNNNTQSGMPAKALKTLTATSNTWNASLSTSAGTAQLNATSTTPAALHVRRA